MSKPNDIYLTLVSNLIKLFEVYLMQKFKKIYFSSEVVPILTQSLHRDRILHIERAWVR